MTELPGRYWETISAMQKSIRRGMEVEAGRFFFELAEAGPRSFGYCPIMAVRWSAARLRASVGMRYALLNPILEELAKEGRINIAVGKHGNLISLKE